jgi:hypothetical protein
MKYRKTGDNNGIKSKSDLYWKSHFGGNASTMTHLSLLAQPLSWQMKPALPDLECVDPVLELSGVDQ